MKETIEFRGNEYIIKYRHERILDDCGNPENRGGATIAYIVLKYDEKGRAYSVIDAVAICNKSDAYDKKLGRKIARGRLEKVIETLEDMSPM